MIFSIPRRTISIVTISLTLFCMGYLINATIWGGETETLVTHDPGNPGPMTQDTFANPPVSVRPWVYYWCLKGHISKEQMTHDLEEMADKGVGGLLVVDSRGYCDDFNSVDDVPVPLYIEYEFMSQGWREIMTHLVSEAARLDLKVSFNISESGGELRGPWDMKENGPRELIWCECNLSGPVEVTLNMSMPANRPYYQEDSVIAVRMSSEAVETSQSRQLSDPWKNVTLPKEGASAYDKVVDISSRVKDNTLVWTVPEGNWKIIRFGTARIGAPGSVDILNADVVEKYFHMMPGTLLNDVGPLAGKTLTHFYNVSWEGAIPNWTVGFKDFFRKKRQYDILEYMPVLAGLVPNGDAKRANRFFRDYYRTTSDAFRENCFRTIGRLCNERGVQWHSENGGPWNREYSLFQEGDMLSFWGENDMPQGEFWAHPGNYFDTTNAAYAAMSAHIYGRRDVSMEAFTRMAYHWTVYPGMLKPYADFNYSLGANFFLWHTFTASPKELGTPGFEYFAGSHVNTNVTWWPWVKPFMDYMARCQLLLRQGLYVADICTWVSDKNGVSWEPAKNWNPNSELIPPPGYRFDLLDSYTFVNRLEYRDGKFILPDGMSYRILVFDPIEDDAPLAVMKKLQSFAEQGAPIVLGKKKPVLATGLADWENADQSVGEIANLLWADTNLIQNKPMADVLLDRSILPDAEGSFTFLHRQTNSSDIYFITGEGDGEMTLRTSDKKAELWNPVDGSVTPIESYQTEDGRTKVALTLPQNGSAFLVFSKDESENVPAITRDQKREVLQKLEGPWQVAFDKQWGGPEQTVFDKLTLWNENEDPGIKFYSGTANYSIDFDMTQEQLSLNPVLSLGEVHDIASVRLNGSELGIVWTAPWEIALGDSTVAGRNHLEITVTNCWSNRLIGDAGLEPEERFTKTNVVLEKENELMTAWRGYTTKVPLMPGGLLGPVVIEITIP
ncbi:MAG: glycosyl hydrolase [Planctomycetia bacterium]|nr:glycosyl hydrolase [Planctomycetia bacterium]